MEIGGKRRKIIHFMNAWYSFVQHSVAKCEFCYVFCEVYVRKVKITSCIGNILKHIGSIDTQHIQDESFHCEIKCKNHQVTSSSLIKSLKESPINGINYLTNYSMLSSSKVAQIIPVLKPGKPPNGLTTYRPISLLPIVSKVFEMQLLKRLLPVM
jgi:hypothetical protein